MELLKCSVCGEEKLEVKFFSYNGKKDKTCKDCRNAYNRERYAITKAPFTKKQPVFDGLSKVCSICNERKSVADFNISNREQKGASRYHAYCKACASEKRDTEREGERGAKYREEHREEIRRKKREYLSIPENREKNRIYAREYAKKRPEMQRIRLLAKYGLDEAGYDILLHKQDGKCAICGKEHNGKHNVFAIDHCHKSNVVRSLLCKQCNVGLGNFFDDPEVLRKAAEYLERFK